MRQSVAVLLGLCGLLTACSSSEPVDVVAVATVSVSPPSATLAIGGAVQLAATVLDTRGGVVTDRTVSWTTENAQVATVSNAGLVTAVGTGTASIFATAQGRIGSAVISVPPVSVASVTVQPSSAVLSVGETRQFSATSRDANGANLTGRVVTWSVTDASVVTVSNTGFATALAPGSVTIVATSEGRTGSASVTVPLVLTSVAVGVFHSCGLTANGFAYCWGFNQQGQLGDGTRGVDRFRPVRVAGGLTFKSLTAGFGHTCGVTTGDLAYCWGENLYGQLGSGANNATCTPHGYSTPCNTNPVPVVGGLAFARLDAGGAHTCGILTNGLAYCWGRNNYGQLGDGSLASRSFPAPVFGGFQFSGISAGGAFNGGYHTCGILTSGQTFCWGNNGSGQLGIGTTSQSQPTPTVVSGGHAFRSITTAHEHSCALTLTGTAYCWGANLVGQLGNGTRASSSLPTLVAGGHSFATLGADGWVHTCGATQSGAAFCWGDNKESQLGSLSATDLCQLPNETISCSLRPVPVTGAFSFVSAFAGGWHSCGLTSSGSVYCWGENRTGQLGNASTAINSVVPVKIIEP